MVLTVAKKQRPCLGFTLLELLIAMALGLVALGAVYSVYVVQQRFYHYQQAVLQTQQNLRGAMVILERQIRLAGYDPQGTGRFGIADVRRYDTAGTKPDALGQPAIFYTADMDENGVEDPSNHFRNGEHLSFSIRDDRNTERLYLAFNMGSGRQPLAENIQALGLAYAVDVDQDGHPDRWAGGDRLIWAVDGDNDNFLDTHLDSNNDGFIDAADDVDGDLRITAADGGLLHPPISIDRICAVRVWLLSVTQKPIRGYVDSGIYVVGDRVLNQPRDKFKRLVLDSIVQCRNL